MVGRYIWMAPAIAALLASCAPAPVLRSVAAPPMPATPPACLNSHTIANTCVARTFGPWSGFVCPVEVERTAAGIVVTPYHLRVPMPPAKVRIVWRLKPTSPDSFDDLHGPTFGTNGEFDEYSPASDDDGSQSVTSGKRFRVSFKNTTGAGTGHRYTLILNGPAGQAACDPVIHNQGG
jgi:hypothetical protein